MVSLVTLITDLAFESNCYTVCNELLQPVDWILIFLVITHPRGPANRTH